MVAVMLDQPAASLPTPGFHDETSVRGSTTTQTARGRRRVRPLCDRSWTALQCYLDSHLAGTTCLEEMAQTACVSRFHFARMFRARVGTSPMEYVMTRRIEMAKEKLAAADTSLCEVAQDLGFFDQSHFGRTFCRRVGVTPGAYRKAWATPPPKE